MPNARPETQNATRDHRSSTAAAAATVHCTVPNATQHTLQSVHLRLSITVLYSAYVRVQRIQYCTTQYSTVSVHCKLYSTVCVQYSATYNTIYVLSTVQYSTAQTVQTVQHSKVQYCMYSTARYSTVQYNTVYNTVQHSSVQYVLYCIVLRSAARKSTTVYCTVVFSATPLIFPLSAKPVNGRGTKPRRRALASKPRRRVLGAKPLQAYCIYLLLVAVQ